MCRDRSSDRSRAVTHAEIFRSGLLWPTGSGPASRAGRTALVFPGFGGRPYDPAHLWTRVLSPACAEAGVEWGGFHTFRHTVASRMFASGRNAVQVQNRLGHHSAAFTLRTYVHLLEPGDLEGPLEPAAVKTLTVEDVIGA